MFPLIFTDLDGTLLDRETYSWAEAEPGVQLLRDRGVPWMLLTSKTLAETEFWRSALGNEHPFAVENGGAVVAAAGYFTGGIPGATRRNGYDLLVKGKPYTEVVAGLEAASRASECRVRGFHEMTVEEVAEVSGLPAEQAALAKVREYDEPFQILERERTPALDRAIARQGLREAHGGRFHHVSGAHDKGCAVRLLASLFGRSGERVRTVGLGNSLSDVPMLLAVDIPVVVRFREAGEVVRRVPNSLVTFAEGPTGWSEAVSEILRSWDESS